MLSLHNMVDCLEREATLDHPCFKPITHSQVGTAWAVESKPHGNAVAGLAGG
jgi:hypothetical protein